MISPLFLEIEAVLQNGQPFEIDENKKLVKLEKVYFIAQILNHSTDIELYSKRFIKNAVFIANTLRITPRKSWDSPLDIQQIVTAVKLFLKSHQKYENFPEFEDCSLELLSFRLGISSDILEEECNLGFVAFAKENHLYNSLMTFNHYIAIDADTSEISIQYQNQLVPWSRAKNLIKEWTEENKKINFPSNPYALSLYGDQGLQNRNRYDWKELRPLLKSNTANWANHFIKNPLIFNENNKSYILEFCSSATESRPRIFAGDHTWTRIYKFTKTDNKIFGKMYSIGLYRPYKHHFIFDNFWMPFCVKKGYLTEDISEEWGINHLIKTVATRINQEIYKKIKVKISQDKATDNIPYHLFGKSCVHYANSLANIADIQLPTESHFLILFTCIHLKNRWDQQLSMHSTPLQLSAMATQKVVTGLLYTLTPFFNLLFYLVGSGLVSKNVKLTPQIKPHLASLCDFFNPNKLTISSPWLMATFINEEIAKWRQTEIKKISKNSPEALKREKEIAFEFPPSYRLH